MYNMLSGISPSLLHWVHSFCNKYLRVLRNGRLDHCLFLKEAMVPLAQWCLAKAPIDLHCDTRQSDPREVVAVWGLHN